MSSVLLFNKRRLLSSNYINVGLEISKEEKLLQPLRDLAYSCLLILNWSLVLVYSTRLFDSWFLRQVHWQFETESLLITWNQLPQKTLNNIATWFEFCAYIYLPICRIFLTNRRNSKISFYLDDGPYSKQETIDLRQIQGLKKGRVRLRRSKKGR